MNQFEEMSTFVRIVEAGSISKAAEQLNTVKSAVSRRLSELETRLGVSLMKRTTRRQTLTESGQQYYQQCIRILDDINELESRIADEQTALTGRIRLTAPISFGLMHLSAPLREFNRLHPDILIDIDFNDRHQDLVAEGLDLAIRISRLSDSTLMARKLATTRLLLCASPDYFAKYGFPESPADLSRGHIRLQYSNVLTGWQFRSGNGDIININLPVSLSANNGNFLFEAALDGQGLILSPDFICYEAIRNGELVPVLSEFIHNPEMGIYAVYPQTRYLSQRVRSLIDYLKLYYSEHNDWTIQAH